MNKKGFTSLELAVSILVLLVVGAIVFLNFSGVFDRFKDKAFRTDAKEIYRVSHQKVLNDKMFLSGTNGTIIYSKSKMGQCEKELPISNQKSDELEYFVEFNKEGKMVRFYVSNGLYQFGSEKFDLAVTDIEDIQLLKDLRADEIYKIGCEDVESNIEKCVDTLTTDKGSFSATESVKSICTVVEEDEYVYTKVEYKGKKEKRTDANDILVINVKLKDKSDVVNVYDSSDKKVKLATIDNSTLPQSRYSINDGLVVSKNTVDVVLGNYDKNTVYVDNKSKDEYELFYVELYTETTYKGPWIKRQQAINKIKNLMSYNLIGFTNCDDNQVCTPNKYKAVFEDKKTLSSTN